MNKTKPTEQKFDSPDVASFGQARAGSPRLIFFEEVQAMMSHFSPSDFDSMATAKSAKKRFEKRFGFLSVVALIATLEEAFQLILPLSQLKVVAEKQGIQMIGKHKNTKADFEASLREFQMQVYGEIIDDRFMTVRDSAKETEHMVNMKTEGGVQ